MRDTNGCANNMSCDAVYKEVVVVGNGPSALSLSYLLAGNSPHYNGLPHPSDDMLTARLNTVPPGRSLLQADLEFLSQGLEGRSRNPVSVLMDSLTHPAADTGLDTPQLVTWRHADRAVDHIVLGKGPPGGAWQAMDGNVLTISLSAWMELPGLEWRRWEARHTSSPPPTTPRRVPVALVAAYYRDYVRLMRLGRYFRNGVVVTSVRRLANQGGQGGDKSEEGGCCCHCSRARWAVRGYDTGSGEAFSYVSRHLVLATGTTDQHNTLAAPGEHANPDWVFHDLAAFEAALAAFVKDNHIKDGVEPVCIVGAGLSASDAVLASRFHSLPIIHVYRHAGVSTLPENMYPEYHKVHQMMEARGQGYPDYTALPEHRVVDISVAGDRKVTTVSPSGLRLVHQVSLMAVLIGSRPDLTFLPEEYQEGQALTVDASRPLDCRSNPLGISPWSHNVANIPGLYALGPLTGDNFVRFLLGGAVTIASDVLRDRKQLSS